VADDPRLTRGARPRWLALIALVLLLHVLAIHWIGRQLQQTALLPKMAEPMFTRLLQQQAPPALVAAAPVEAAPAPARPQVRSVAPRAPKPRRAASQPVAPPPPVEAPPASAASEAPDAAPAPQEPFDVAMSAAAAAAAASAPQPAASSTAVAAPLAAPASSAVAAAAPRSGASAPAGPPIGPDGWPTDTRVNYRLGGMYRGALHGSAQVQWLRQEQRYETKIDIDITLLANLVMTSQGSVTPRGLRPEAYEEQRRGGARRTQLRDDTILLGNGQVVPRPDGVQDTASQFVELSHRFASGQETLEVGRNVTLWLARPGGVDRWTYDVVGRDILQTPELGPVEAFHLKPRPLDKPRGTITAEIWFAPSLQYLPVRIKVTMDESTYVDLVVMNIQQR